MTNKFNINFRVHLNGFVEAITNIFIFLPHFFSIPTISKSLFRPWKNITTISTKPGFSLNESFNLLMFDLISRGVGFTMRISVLTFFIILLSLYIVIIPLLFVSFVLLIPLISVFLAVLESEEARKMRLKQDFIHTHLLKETNYQDVEKWFEYVYETQLKPKKWWKLSILLSIPPLARDWAYGYTPILDKYSEDLTSTTYQMGIRQHIIGREQESSLIERSLSKTDEANVIVVGEEGVGKMTIINALAKNIYEGKANSILSYKRMLRLNMEKILNISKDQIQRETFLEELFEEAAHAKNVIILIDNFEQYASTGENHLDLSLSIAKYASTDKLQIIGITTPFLYQKFIFPNAHIRNIMTKVDVIEITSDKALQILLDKAMFLEMKHKLTIPYETILEVIEKSNFFVTTIPFPEKALQLLDIACVYTNQTFSQKVVMPDIVDEVLTKKTHIPASLTEKLKVALLHLEESLSQKIQGQADSVKALTLALQRSFLLMGKRKKPLASFLFLGPTGVGKTETAKALASIFFGSETYLLRFDMSNYQTILDIASLIGSVEKLNPGLLTTSVREHPYGVLLLDEIEKAHPDILNIFLTILDEGYFTDGYGSRVDCKNLVIIATSNAGTDFISKLLLKQQTTESLNINGFINDEISNYLIDNKLFSPEFLNRFDGVIVYKPLDHISTESIARSQIELIKKQIYELYKIKLVVSEDTIKYLSSQGYSLKYGIRNLERVLRTDLEAKIAKKILENKVKEEETLIL